MDWKLEIRWENNIFKNVKDSSHRPAMIGYNKWRRMINSILCTQDTITSAKVHTSTSQIYLIQCHPLYSQLQPLMPISYSLNTPCSSPLQSLFGLLVPSSYLFHPWLFAGSTLFHLSSLNSAFHISERASFALQCKPTPSTLLFPIQNSLFIPLISTSKMKFSSLSLFIM